MNGEKNPHAVGLGRLGGLVGGLSKSARKRAAAKRNGKKGGRPKKVHVVKVLQPHDPNGFAPSASSMLA